MPRFVVLRHQTPPGYARGLHWDFMLENDDALQVWALSEEPHRDRSICAELLADHRLFYLDYEGTVSHDRGHVKRWDHGAFQWITREENLVRVDLAGRELVGRVDLKRSGEFGNQWRFDYSVD